MGTATHAAGSRYPDLPSVGTTVTGLAAVLTERCRVAPDRLAVLAGPEDPLVFARTISEVARPAGDVFLLWFVGHSVLSADGELQPATRATIGLTPDDGDFQALPYRTARARLAQDCPARSVVVLDACRAGRAVGALPTGRLVSAVDWAVSGSCLLAASSRDEASYALAGSRHTGFTGVLIELLRRGDRDAGPELTVGQVVRHLCRTLPERGLPVPDYGATGAIDDLVLARNPAHRPPAAPTPPGVAPGREFPDVIHADVGGMWW